MEDWTKVEISVTDLSETLRQHPSLSIKVFLNSSLKSLASPFSKPIVFDFEQLEPNSQVVISVESNGSELAYGELSLPRSGELREWLQLASQKLPSSRIQIEIIVSKGSPPMQGKDWPAGNEGCPRCSYLEKLEMSQRTNVMALEESKTSYTSIKNIVKEHYDPDVHIYLKATDPEVEELGIDMPDILPATPLNKQEAQHLRELNLGLNEKLKGLQVLQSEVRAMREQLLDSQTKRVNLQESIKETTQQFAETSKKHEQKFTDLASQRAQAHQDLLKLKQDYSVKVLENDNLVSTISQLKAEIEQLNTEVYNFRNMRDHIASLQSELETSQQKREELRLEFTKAQKDFENKHDLQSQEIKRLQDEKASLLQEIEELNGCLKDQKNANEELKRENLDFKASQSKLQSTITILENENQELQETRERARAREDSCTQLQEKLHNAAKAFESEIQNLEKLNQNLQTAKADVTMDLNATENALENKRQEAHDLSKETFRLMDSLKQIEQQLVVQIDREQILKLLDSQERTNEKCKDILVGELNSMAEYMSKQSEESLALSQTVMSCSRILEEKESHIKNLNSLVSNLRNTRPEYVPDKRDELDLQVAQFLNLREDWKTVSFFRKSPGEYVLGTKNIVVFSDDTQVMVRLGKGVMSLEEFLEVYVPLETNKKQVLDQEQIRQQLVASYLNQ